MTPGIIITITIMVIVISLYIIVLHTVGIIMTSQYFKKHRALANGLCVGGTAAGSMLIPPSVYINYKLKIVALFLN